jgi:protein SCO1/2
VISLADDSDRPLAQAGGRFLFLMNLKRGETFAWVALSGIMLLVALVYIRERRAVGASLPVLAPAAPFLLTNQFGIRVQNTDLSGYVMVIDVIFSRCPGQCHRLSQQMRRLQQSVEVGLPVRFISLTADPEFDTPQVLQRYAERYGADGASWNFLTGPKRDLYRWAQEGLKFSVVENEPSAVKNLEDLFIHSASFAILDRNGRLRAMIQSEDADSSDRILECVKSLSAENFK